MSHTFCSVLSSGGFPLPCLRSRYCLLHDDARGTFTAVLSLQSPVLFLSLSRLCFCKVLISHRGSGSNPRTPWQPDNAREYKARVPTLYLILFPSPCCRDFPSLSKIMTVSTVVSRSCGCGGWGLCVRTSVLLSLGTILSPGLVCLSMSVQTDSDSTYI